MLRVAVPVLCLLLAACSSDKPADPGPGGPVASKPAEPEPPMPTPNWQGPAAECSLEAMESQPLQHAVNVKISVPSGGYELTHDKCEKTAAGTRVLLTLTSPAPEEGVTMAFETKTVRVDLGTDPGKVCQVWICAKVRNAQYVKAPEYQLARILPVGLSK